MALTKAEAGTIKDMIVDMADKVQTDLSKILEIIDKSVKDTEKSKNP